MGSIRLAVGTEWLFDGRAYRIVRQLASDQFVVSDVRFNLERVWSSTEILSPYSLGQLCFSTTEGPPAELAKAPARAGSLTMEGLSARERRALERRWQALEPLTALGRTPVAEDFKLRAEGLIQSGIKISSRSLRRYWRVWQRSNGDRMALRTGLMRCGHRGQKRRTGSFSRHPILRQFADDAIRSVYLTMARRPISAVARRVLEDLQQHNARLLAGQAVPIPRPATLARAVARQIRRLDPWEVDRARWGRRIADRRHKPTSPQRLATRILERVECDHCLLKVVVGSEAGPLGQPWLTVLVDYYSRMIVGCSLGFEPPSYGVIMEALRHSILPKGSLRQRYPRIVGDWPCYGIPEKVVCDRGADLTSNDLENAAFQLGIALDFAPPRTPHFKGTVESFFDTLNDQLLAGLPGRTFRSWEKRADYKPDDGPLLSLEALTEILYLHLVDVYAQEKHPTAAKTRLEMWQEGAAEIPPALPASPDDLIMLLSKSTERMLSNRGIELAGMFYMSDEIMALRAELAANNCSPEQLTVRYNPWDLGTIWVQNPIDRRYLKAVAVDSTLQGMTEYQWRVLRRAVRERFDQPDHVTSLAAARNVIRDVVTESVQTPSRNRRVRAARFLNTPAGNTQPDPDPNLTAEVEPTESTSYVDPAEINVDDWEATC